MKKRNRKGLELTRSISAVLLSIGMVLQPMVPAMSPLVTIHAEEDNGGTGVTPAASISDNGVKADDSTNTLSVKVEGTVPNDAKVVVNYTVNGRTFSALMEKSSTEDNVWTWTAPNVGNSKVDYQINSIDVLNSNNASVLNGGAHTVSGINISVDKTNANFNIEYQKDENPVNPTKAIVSGDNLSRDTSNNISLEFYDSTGENVYESGSVPVNNGKAEVDFSSFVNDIKTNGTYQAYILYNDEEYSPETGKEITIDQAPYVVSSSILPDGENAFNDDRATNKKVNVIVTMSEPLNENLTLEDGQGNLILTKNNDSNVYSGSIDVDNDKETLFNPSNFVLTGKDFSQQNIIESDGYKAFKDIPSFTIDKKIPEVTSIAFKNNSTTPAKDIALDTFVNTRDGSGNAQGITITVTTDDTLKGDLTINYKRDGVDASSKMTQSTSDPNSYSVTIDGSNDGKNDSGKYSDFSFTGSDAAGNSVKLSNDETIRLTKHSYNIDDQAPNVELKHIYIDNNDKDDLKESKNINFGNKNVLYQIEISDSLSGLEMNNSNPVVKYAVSTDEKANLEDIKETDWKDPNQIDKVDLNNKDDNKYTVTINAPKKVNKIFIKVADNQQNEATTEYVKPVVIENNSPVVSDISVTDTNDSTDRVKDSHKVEFKADDNTSDDSGVESISFYLTKGDANATDTDKRDTNEKVSLEGLVNLDSDFENKDTVERSQDNTTVTIKRKANDDGTPSQPLQLSDLPKFASMDTKIDLSSGAKLNGLYYLHVTTTDFCKNTSEEKTKEVWFDTTPPTITLKFNKNAVVKNEDGKYYYNAGNAEFKVTVNDEDNGSGVANKSELVVSRVDDSGNVINTVTKQFEKNIDFNLAGNNFADGNISITVKAEDKAGNVQETFKGEDNNPGLNITDNNDKTKSTGSFVYDTTAPVANVTYEKPSRTEKDVVFFNANTTSKKAHVSVADVNFDSSKIHVNTVNGSNKTIVNFNDSEYTAEFNADGEYHLAIDGTDKAGNPVIVREQDITNAEQENKQDVDSSTKADRIVTTANAVVVDTVRPVVTVSYNNPSNAAYVKTEYNLYYGNTDKDKQSVSFTFTDDHVGKYDLNVKNDLHVYQIKDNVKGSDIGNQNKTQEISFENMADGTYSYSFEGSQDRAGNPVQVVQEYKVGETTTNLESANYNVVIDRKNPVASIAVNAPHASDGGRDYYGRNEGNINATFTVTEKNFDSDSDLIKFGYALNKDGRYADSTVDWNKGLNSKLTGSNGTFTGTTGALSDEGVYKLEIEGHDKAMNPIVAADDQLKHPTADKKDDEKLWTNEKVLDKSINAKLTVANTSGNAYFNVDFIKGASAGNLYRNENDAVVTADAAGVTDKDYERSPYKINYVLKSSLQDENITQTTGDNYKYDNPLQYTVKENQRFHVVSAYIEDMAGNVASIGEQTEIYLDTVSPHADDINKPVASIQAYATSNITARTADGRPLYGDKVIINLNVTDPNSNGKITSSGLKNIVYTVKADGVVVQHQTDAEANLNDPNLFNWHKDIVVDNDTNNIEVDFYGFDNAGNKSNSVSYNFGIDLKGPKITVNYDNNDAQHDKYFKANRIATVTVQDRNIDFSKINIKTQVGHSDLSPAVANSTGNGNNDTRTFTIPYTQDGDYTLEITGTDAVNHPAEVIYNGTAPRDFTIDKTAPVIKVSFDNNDVQNGKYYKAARTATINVNEHNFLGNEVKVDQTATIQRGTTSVPGVSGFSTGSDSHNATIRYNQDGNYTLTVNYTDMAGNQAAPVTVSEFTIDQTAPVVKIDGVKNNAAYNGEVMPTVTIDDTNFSEDLASFVLNGVKIKDRSNLLTSRVVNEFGATIRFENIAAIKDNDDVYTATAVVTDLAGNVTRTQVRFSVNRFGSTYDYGDSATKSLMTKYFDKKTGSVLINEINVNQLHDQKVYLNFNGGTEELEEGKDYKITVSQMEDGSGYKYTYEIFSSVFKKQGTYSITVQSVDEAGNINTNATVKEGNDVVDVPFEFAIDTTNPVITSTENLEPDVLWTKTHDAEHTFSFTTTDNMSISKLTYAVTDADGNPIGKEETLDADQLKAVNNMVSVDLRSANTNQYIKLTAVDAAGNTLTAMYSIYMNANALSRAWHFYWYVFLLIGAGIAVLIFFLVRNSKNKKKAA